MSEIYGCYMANYQKKYRWQCRLFDEINEASKFAVEGAEKSNTPSPVIILVNPLTPNLLRPMVIQNSIKRLFPVDILE
jgi:hypothetical protein